MTVINMHSGHPVHPYVFPCDTHSDDTCECNPARINLRAPWTYGAIGLNHYVQTGIVLLGDVNPHEVQENGTSVLQGCISRSDKKYPYHLPSIIENLHRDTPDLPLQALGIVRPSGAVEILCGIGANLLEAWSQGAPVNDDYTTLHGMSTGWGIGHLVGKMFIEDIGKQKAACMVRQPRPSLESLRDDISGLLSMDQETIERLFSNGGLEAR